MLSVGLTGGIGSGKSTVARRLRELGCVVVDADAVARDVLDRDGDGLAEVVARFGEGVLAPDGSLDRAALAGVVFGDDEARKDLEAITHPRIAARTQELFAQAPPEAIRVHDVPLLVEKNMGRRYHLVVVVDANPQVRVERLIGRGLPETDARARMSRQASDGARRAAADVLLDNDGDEAALFAQVEALYADRLVPFDENLRAQRVYRREDTPTITDHDEEWDALAHRLIARVGHALGERAPEIEHVGSTSVPGMGGKDVIDLQIGVADLTSADDPAFVGALTAAGFPRVEDYRMDHPTDDLPDPSLWVKRFHGSCDPARVVHIHVRELSSAGWQYALLFRDWLRANEDARADYEELKSRLTPDSADYATAKEAWFNNVWPRMQTWAQKAGWHD